MRIEQLAFLVEISKRRSMNVASESLHITPQALSRSISSMENELGVKLLARSYRGVHLTDAGEKLVGAAERILAEYHQVLKELTDNCAAPVPMPALKGRLVIYTHQVFSLSVLPDILGDFYSRYPSIKVELLEESTSRIFDLVSQRAEAPDQYRMGLVTIPASYMHSSQWQQMTQELVFQPVLSGYYKACVSPRSDLAGQKAVSFRTLANYPIVQFANNERDMGNVFSYFVQRYHLKECRFASSSIEPWIHAIANNIGVGLIHNIVFAKSSAIRESFNKIVVLDLQEDTSMISGFLFSPEPAAVIDAFVQHFPKL